MTMNKEEILQMFKETGVLTEGHFRLTSGLHADKYLQFAKLMQYPEVAAPVFDQLAEGFKNQGITVVAGPATGAIIMAYEIARAIGARAIFGERDGQEMKFRRGFEIQPREKVLVVEDVITTGGSAKDVLIAARALSGDVVGVAVLADRSENGMKELEGAPVQALIQIKAALYQPEECPMCKAGSVAIKPGSRQI